MSIRMLAAILAAFVFFISRAEAQPVLSFDGGESVIATGITPGGRAVSYGVIREAQGYGLRLSHGVKTIRDDDANGAVAVLTDRQIPWNSVFIVVDETSGASAVAGPRSELYTTTLERLNPGQVRKVVRSGAFAAFVLVRPGVGAWTLAIEDSGTNDDDAVPDGRLALELERMVPVDDAPSPPRTFERSDVLFGIDPMNLSVVEWRAQ